MRTVALSLLLVLLVAACGGDQQEAIPLNEQHLAGEPTLLFAAMEPGGSWDVYAEEVASKQRTNLTNTAVQGAVRADDRSPALSPDGTRIAYTSTADNASDGEVEIFVMALGRQRAASLDRRRRRRRRSAVDSRRAHLLHHLPVAAGGSAVLSARPDLAERLRPANCCRQASASRSTSRSRRAADRVAFAGLDERLQPRGLFVVDLTSGEQERLADGVGPRWSPDGERIAFLRGRDVYVIDSDGSDERRLTETPGCGDTTPAGRRTGSGAVRAHRGRSGLPSISTPSRVDGDCEVQLTKTEASETSPSSTGPTDSLDC